MVNEDFNRDLNDYLKDKRKGSKGPFFDLFKRKNKGVKMSDDETNKKNKEEEFDEIEEMEEEAEELEVEEEEIEDKKEGLVRRLLKKMRIIQESEVEDEESEIQETDDAPDTKIDENTKKVLKMSYDWLKYMPEYKLKDFKESDDFKLYKDVLKKYGLIKEKE